MIRRCRVAALPRACAGRIDPELLTCRPRRANTLARTRVHQHQSHLQNLAALQEAP